MWKVKNSTETSMKTESTESNRIRYLLWYTVHSILCTIHGIWHMAYGYLGSDLQCLWYLVLKCRCRFCLARNWLIAIIKESMQRKDRKRNVCDGEKERGREREKLIMIAASETKRNEIRNSSSPINLHLQLQQQERQ